MRSFALFSIRVYQKYISPYKGFRCAYSVHTGCASCSELGYRVVRRRGVVGGLSLLFERMHLCGVAHRRYSSQSDHPHRPLKTQRGDCDVGCDSPGDCGSDASSGRSLSRVLDFASCCDAGSCDWGDKKRKEAKQDKDVYIPPMQKNRFKKR